MNMQSSDLSKATEQLAEGPENLIANTTGEKILNDFLEKVQSFGFDRVRLYCLSEDGLHMVGKAHIGMSENFVGSERYVDDDPYMKILRDTSRPRVFERDPGMPAPFIESVGEDQPDQWACLPIVIDGEVIGKLSVDNVNTHRPIAEEKLGPIMTLIAQSAQAIEQARLLTIAERKSYNLSALLRLSNTISSSLDLEQTLMLACKAVVEFLHADHSALALFSPDHATGKVYAEYPDQGMGKSDIPINGIEAEEELISFGRPIIVPDVQNEFSLGPVRDLLISRGIQSVVILPVRNKEKTLGSLSVDMVTRRRIFSSEEIEFLRIFASQVAAAIVNAQLYTEANIFTNSSPIGIIHVDRHGRVERYNYRAQEMLEYKKNEEFPNLVSQLYYNTNTPYEIGRIMNIQGGRLVGHEVLAKSQSNDPIPIRLSAVWLYDTRGERVGSIGYFEDLRPIKDIETQRKVLVETIENVARSENLSEGLQSLSETMVSLLGHTFCRIFLVDEKEEYYIPMAAYAPPSLEKKKLLWDPGIGKPVLISKWRGLRKLLQKGETVVLRRDDIRYRKNIIKFSRWLHLEHDIQSLLMVPLKIGENVVGAIQMGETKKVEQVPFTKEQIQFTSALAAQSIFLINHMRLRDISERRNELLSKVKNTAEILARMTVLGNPDVLNSFPTETKAALGCDSVQLYVYEGGTTWTEFPLVTRIDQSIEHSKKIVDKKIHSLLLGILREEQPQIVENNGANPLFSNGFADQSEEFKSCIAIPLKSSGQSVGVMFVYYRHPHQLTVEELASTNLFADQAAVAIRNFQLFEELGKRTIALEALRKASRIVTSSLDLSDIFNSIAEQACMLVNFQGKPKGYAAIWSIRNKKAYLSSVYPSSDFSEIQKQFRDGIPLRAKGSHRIGIIGRCANEAKPQRVPDVRCDKDYLEAYLKTLSELAVPIIIDNKVIGIINIEHIDFNAFTKEDEKTLKALADQAAIAIQNAQAYRELKAAQERAVSATSVALIGMAAADWRHATGSDAIAIQDNVQLIRDSLAAGEPLESVCELLENIKRSAEAIQTALTSEPLSQEDVESVAVDKWLQKRMVQLEDYKSFQGDLYSKVNFKFIENGNEDIISKINTEWLTKAFHYLIDNAVEAMAESSPRELSASIHRGDEIVEIRISDTGRGIPPHLKSQILTHPIRKSKGSRRLGTGLLQARTIVQAYRGDIKISDTGPKGTIMSIILPISR